MQTMTTAQIKQGFSLRLFTFKKSIQKAEAVKPEVRYTSNRSSMVQCSDGTSFVQVRFELHGSEIYACCSCFAAMKAKPCYHIAAAALDRGAISHSVNQVRAVAACPVENTIDDFYEANHHDYDEQREEDFAFSIRYEIDETDFPTDEQIEEMAIQQNRFTPASTDRSQSELIETIRARWNERYPYNSEFWLRSALLKRFGVSHLKHLNVGFLEQILEVL